MSINISSPLTDVISRGKTLPVRLANNAIVLIVNQGNHSQWKTIEAPIAFLNKIVIKGLH